MRIVMLGLNHQTAGVELREKLALDGQRLERLLASVHDRFPGVELVALSTCNRVEVYIARPAHAQPTAETLRALLAQVSGVDLASLTQATIHRENEQAVGHLFRVCTGLESMVLGEPQILGQVRKAYEQAQAHASVGPVLHRVFQQAIAVSRAVRAQTGIDKGRLSVGSVAVDFARRIFERFDDKTVVGIGAGEMAKLTLTHLRALAPARLWLTNRSPDRASALAAKLGLGPKTPAESSEKTSGGGVRGFEDLDELLVEADIVLTSTASESPIITVDRFKPLLKRRRFRPLFLLDIAVPRDVEAGVGSLRNVYLYNIDDLQQVVNQTQGQRSSQAVAAQAMLADAVGSCLRQVQHSDVGRLIKELRHRLEELGRVEQERTLRKLSTTDPARTAELLQEHTHRLIGKILHLPMSQLDRKSPDAPLGFYATALRRLFQLDPENPSTPGAIPGADAEQSKDEP